MTWRVVFNARVEQDVAEAAAWYETKRTGLGHTVAHSAGSGPGICPENSALRRIFRQRTLRPTESSVVPPWRDFSLADNPLLGARKHPVKNLRWRYPERFPYRVIYEVDESARTVIVAAVVHAARQNI